MLLMKCFLLPDVIILLKQAFWSIRDHITYSACGFLIRNVSIESTKLILVATGTNKQCTVS